MNSKDFENSNVLILDSTGPGVTSHFSFLAEVGIERLEKFKAIHAFSGGIFAYLSYYAYQNGLLRHDVEEYVKNLDRQFIDFHHCGRKSPLGLFLKLLSGKPSILTLPFPAAVKTGTSKDMRDNWCVGWSTEYTVGVWVGNFNGDPMWNVSGVTGAAPIWRALMLSLNKSAIKTVMPRYQAPNQPLIKRTISRIRYPAPATLVGMDPDIPENLQKLPIEIENPQQGHQIFLDDGILGDSRTITMWPLARGPHRISLKDKNGYELDTVTIEVR